MISNFCHLLGAPARMISDQLAIPFYLRTLGATLAPGCRFAGFPIVSIYPGTFLGIGSRAFLISKSSSTALGVSHRIVLRTLAIGASIKIGNDTGISGGSFCAAKEIRIGDNCLFGADVIVTDTDFHPTAFQGRRHAPLSAATSRPVSIGDNVFVGARAVILKGVKIGSNSVIGAGSVVTDSIPEGVIAAGNPCRMIRVLN